MVTATGFAAALIMRMGMCRAIRSMCVAMRMFVIVVVVAAIGFATAFIMRMAVRSAVGMRMGVRMLMCMVVIAAISLAAAFGVLVRMSCAVSVGMGMCVLIVSHDQSPLLNVCNYKVKQHENCCVSHYFKQIMSLQSISY